jgi:hypothetical protein
MKKSKLVIDYDFDFELWGVISVSKGYKLAWELNQRLDIRLVKQPDLVVGFKKGEEKSFSFFAFETPLNRLKLFKNKPVDVDSGKYYLIPEFPHYDFILLTQMEGELHEKFIPQLKEIPTVELVASIPLEGLKSKLNFIF